MMRDMTPTPVVMCNYKPSVYFYNFGVVTRRDDVALRDISNVKKHYTPRGGERFQMIALESIPSDICCFGSCFCEFSNRVPDVVAFRTMGRLRHG